MSTAAAQNRRLFVGNLSESVDEYTLIKFLSKHGKISKFDYLFHKSGPKQGKPRGYAFVEYGTSEEALKTMIELDGKLLLGRKVAIKRANEAPPEHTPSGSGAWRGTGQKHTTLSVLKGHGKPESAENKIKALEAKLQALDAQKSASDTSRQASLSISDAEGTPGPESSSAAATAGGTEAGPSILPAASTSTLQFPSSLPSKPPSSLPTKPDQDTISKGEKAQKSHKAELEQKQEQKFDSQRHRGGPNRDKNKNPVEVPKSTLASLGASMGK